MSCTECQKRMHFNSNGLEPKGRGAGGRARGLGEAVHGMGSPPRWQGQKTAPPAAITIPRGQRGSMELPREPHFRFGLLGFFLNFFKCQVSLKNQQYIPTALQDSLLQPRLQTEMVTSPHFLNSVILATQVFPHTPGSVHVNLVSLSRLCPPWGQEHTLCCLCLSTLQPPYSR